VVHYPRISRVGSS